MPHVFKLHRESLKRKYSVYVVVAKGDHDTLLYVGKVGDNRAGCNPLISRCGNHFSYNDIHSQVRNKISDHELRDYVYVFEHVDDYPEDEKLRRECIDKINEIERWLNKAVQALVLKRPELRLMNPYGGMGYLCREERAKRQAFRTPEVETIIRSIVTAVEAEVGKRQGC